MIAMNDIITIISYSLYKFWIDYINRNKKNNFADLRTENVCHEIDQNSAVIQCTYTK